MDPIFQKFCVVTDKPGPWISAEAEAEFPFVNYGHCTICGTSFKNSKLRHPCFNCASKAPAYDKHRAPFVYEGPVQELVQEFKYKAEFWVRDFYKQAVQRWKAEFAEADLILPIPLHANRLKERGYNQSVLLAEVWKKVLDKPLERENLIRVKETDSQTELNKIQRLKNLREAFELKDPDAVKNQVVLLVDDVHTTGATLHTAAELLKKAGAKKVFAATFAIVA